MADLDDQQLLAAFSRENSEPAFAALVQRHVNLVFSAARRCTGDDHAAQEVAQAVFIILARKAASLSPRTVLAGWLWNTTRLTAANYLRGEARRLRREQEAYMQSQINEVESEPAWQAVGPWLDEALAKLGTQDRDAIVMRYFENKTLREIGALIGATDDAAKMRVNRALEKLRKIFAKRGVTLSAVAIGGMISVNSVQAAPASLATMISSSALTHAVAGGSSTATLVKGVLKIMAWTKAKIAVTVAVGLLVTAGTATVVVREIPLFGGGVDKYFLQIDSQEFDKIPPYLIVRPTHFGNKQIIYKGSGTSGIGTDQRTIGRSLDFVTMLGYAYTNHHTMRFVKPDSLPRGNFDYLCTVPGGLQKLRDEIARQFGVTAHMETVTTNVLALKVRNGIASKLTPSNGSPQRQLPDGKARYNSLSAAGLADQLEYILGERVVDQTGLAGTYDVVLEVPNHWGDASLRQTMADQLGLDLVPTNLPIDLLIIEKAGAQK